MADPEDLSLAGDVTSDDGDTIKDAVEGAAGVGGDGVGSVEDGQYDDADSNDDHSTPPVAIGNGLLKNRYREIMQRQNQDGSDVSSLAGSELHGLPRRVGSPIDSVLSGPDDTPSVQVRPNSIASGCEVSNNYRGPSCPLPQVAFSLRLLHVLA